MVSRNSFVLIIFCLKAFFLCTAQVNNNNSVLTSLENKDTDYPLDNVIKKYFEPPSSNVDTNKYHLCLKTVISPLLDHCTLLQEGVETFDAFQRLKIAIDLTVCDFTALDHYAFDPDNKMDMLIKDIMYIYNDYEHISKDRNTKSTPNFLNQKYQKIFKLIKQDPRIWTTFSIKNEKINKICTEFELPLQRIKLESIVKLYSSNIESMFAHNNKLLNEKFENLENRIDVKLAFLQHEQELQLSKTESQFRKRFKETLKHTENKYNKLKDKLKQNEAQVLELEQSYFLFKKDNIMYYFIKFSNNIKPLLKFKYLGLAASIVFWSYKVEIIKIAVVSYLLTFELLNFATDCVTTKTLVTVVIVAFWQLNLLKVIFRYRNKAFSCLLWSINASCFTLNMIEFGLENKKRGLLFVISSALTIHKFNPWKNIKKTIIITMLMACITFVNLGMSIYDLS